jgi:hypothetical protein
MDHQALNIFNHHTQSMSSPSSLMPHFVATPMSTNPQTSIYLKGQQNPANEVTNASTNEHTALALPFTEPRPSPEYSGSVDGTTLGGFRNVPVMLVTCCSCNNGPCVQEIHASCVCCGHYISECHYCEKQER